MGFWVLRRVQGGWALKDAALQLPAPSRCSPACHPPPSAPGLSGVVVIVATAAAAAALLRVPLLVAAVILRALGATLAVRVGPPDKALEGFIVNILAHEDVVALLLLEVLRPADLGVPEHRLNGLPVHRGRQEHLARLVVLLQGGTRGKWGGRG